MASVLYEIRVEKLCRKLKQSPSVVLVLATAVQLVEVAEERKKLHFITGNIDITSKW